MAALSKTSAGCYRARELHGEPGKVTFEDNCLCTDILGVAFQTEGTQKQRFWGRNMLSILKEQQQQKKRPAG